MGREISCCNPTVSSAECGRLQTTLKNPSSTWTSPGGLMLQLGDAAHSFLPTSANGATQAIEDAISIAAYLGLAGKHSPALATRVHTKLRSVYVGACKLLLAKNGYDRFQRVACAQRSRFKNRERWPHTNFEAVRKNPEILARINPPACRNRHMSHCTNPHYGVEVPR